MPLPAHVLWPISDDIVRRAVELWHAGACVAFPTETVYGLGARADDDTAVSRIFEAKGRPAHNPLIVHVATAEDVLRVALSIPPRAMSLVEVFWPGPLTLVLPKRPGAVAPRAVASGSTIAVRVPAHPAAQRLLGAAGIPIAAPSANRSTFVSPTEARHVMASLEKGVELVVDAGPTGYGIESTIVDVTREPFTLLRYGAIPLESLAAHVEIVDVASGVTEAQETARSPGREARHYSPRAPLSLVPTDEIAALRERLTRSGERVGAVVRSASAVDRQDVLVEVLPEDAAAYAARLFASLHRLDDAGCDRILVASVPETPAWAAVADRLRRAAQGATSPGLSGP